MRVGMVNLRHKTMTTTMAWIAIAVAWTTWVGQVRSQSEGTFLSGTRQLIFEGKRSGEGYFSQDGKKLIFQSEREADNPFYQIYVLDLETGESRRLSPGIGKTTCAYFRWGGYDEALFASTHEDPRALEKQKQEIEFRKSGKERRYAWDYDETMDIFSVKTDGTGIKNLTRTPGYDAEGAYSPDGSKIVFCSTRHAYPLEKLSEKERKIAETDIAYFGEIYLMNADGTGVRRLTDWPGYDGGPFFSPDGKRIIFRHFSEDGTVADVYTMNLDGSDKKRLTDFGSMSWAPFFHPSGDYVIFASNKHGFGNFELFIVDAEGTKEPVRVTYTDKFDGLAVFSPDGKKLAWCSGRTTDGKSQIFWADWNDAAARAALANAPPRMAHSLAGARPAPAAHGAGHFHGDEFNELWKPEITAAELEKTVRFLASDALGGRMTGSEGEKLAAEYAAARFRQSGLKPVGKDYFHLFDFTSDVAPRAGGNVFRAVVAGKEIVFEPEKDFSPMAFGDNGKVSGGGVFVGYGLKLAEGEGQPAHDDYAGLEVKDKVVFMFRGVPQDVSPERLRRFNRYADLRYKAMMAREQGAKAVVVIDEEKPDRPIPVKFDRTAAASGIVAASLRSSVFDVLLKPSGKNFDALKKEWAGDNPHRAGFELKDLSVHLQTDLVRQTTTGRNVVALLPPAQGNEYVVVGAHYDHLGRGETASRAEGPLRHEVHNGADDNASGTAVVLELADHFADLYQKNPREFKKGIVFALWSGEELGLIGSSAYCEQPPVPAVACLNFDMVGRLKDNELILQGVGSSNSWKSLIEKRNVAAGFNLKIQQDPYLPTDATSFYLKQVPILSFFTGLHEQYHHPDDDADLLDYAGMERIAQFSAGLLKDLVFKDLKPDYVKVAASSGMSTRRVSGVYLGTIPDYVSDEQGLKLSGVRPGSPAEKAGLKGGDIVVELGGMTVKNIYDYTYAIDGLKVGQKTTLVVLRDGKKVKLDIIPGTRD
jgi:Tol biopolymer transport system component